MYEDFFDPPATEIKPKHKESISSEKDDDILPDEDDTEDSEQEIDESDNDKEDDETLEDDQESDADKGKEKANLFESKHEKQSKKVWISIWFAKDLCLRHCASMKMYISYCTSLVCREKGNASVHRFWK